MIFTEEKLENAIIELLKQQEISHVEGKTINRDSFDVLLKDDLHRFLKSQYAGDGITVSEVEGIIRMLESKPASNLYDSNKVIMKMVSDGFPLRREDRNERDIFIQLIDYSAADKNLYKMVNQLEINGFKKRIPDGILYINGLPLVVFEFKSTVRKECTIHDAYTQLTVRYKRDIPELFKYNAFCVISDGVNSKVGSFFALYEFYYAWRKIKGDETLERDGIGSLVTMIKGMFDKHRLRDIIHNFIYFSDTPKGNEKIFCRYPQYYAATKLYQNILKHRKPEGDGKGGTYSGATGSGKSFTMLFLTRLLMRSIELSSPTIVLITDRTDLDDQLSSQFTNAKDYVGDNHILSVESRSDLREKLRGRNSGGVFLTTIHKFTEDTKFLTGRNNVICISDEAHRSQVNLDQKVKLTSNGVRRSYSFARHLHDSLPNATYVGFTGTPIDATLNVFGDEVDTYTMTESVKDKITVRIVYEGRAAKILSDNSKLKEIEDYYNQCADEGASDYAIEESKKAIAQMNSILGDPERIKALAADFIQHYERRIFEGSTIKGKAMFVCSSRLIAYKIYKEVIALRPEWAEAEVAEAGADLTEKEKREIKPMERVKMVMTHHQDDQEELYKLLGDKKYRKELDRQFKEVKSNFKIAIVVDMWLTGFDVPFLDTIYIDKPVKRHNLIQTISRVNRQYANKEKGLVVDYIGIKRQMDLALAHYSQPDIQNIEDIQKSVDVVKGHLVLLAKLFQKFDKTLYFSGSPLQQLECLNMAAEFVQMTQGTERCLMVLTKILKAAYDICCGSEKISEEERDLIYFYIAVRSIIFKLTKGNAPDTTQMNAKVLDMVKDALQINKVEEIFQLGDGQVVEVDISDDDYLAKIERIELPNTKFKILQKLLAKDIEDFKRINKVKGTDFSKRFQALVTKYNDREERDVLHSEVPEEFTDKIIDLYHTFKKERNSLFDLGIDLEEKAFYDILKELTRKYDFSYRDDLLVALSREVKRVVDDKARYTDWNQRREIKAELKANLIVLRDKYNYPKVSNDEMYQEILEQAENFKEYREQLQLHS